MNRVSKYHPNSFETVEKSIVVRTVWEEVVLERG